MIEEAVCAWLKAQAAVVALAGPRVDPDMSPKGTAFPRITYQRVSTTRGKVLRGRQDLVQAIVQVDSWGLSKSQAAELDDAVRAALEDWQEASKRGTPAAWGNTEISAAFIADEGTSYESPVDSSDVGTYGYRLDLEIWFKQPAVRLVLTSIDPTSIPNVPGTYVVRLYGRGFTAASLVHTQAETLATRLIDETTLEIDLTFVSVVTCIQEFEECLLTVHDGTQTSQGIQVTLA
jgi:hypothetical protein